MPQFTAPAPPQALALSASSHLWRRDAPSSGARGLTFNGAFRSDELARRGAPEDGNVDRPRFGGARATSGVTIAANVGWSRRACR
jgi:hypothetical protein